VTSARAAAVTMPTVSSAAMPRRATGEHERRASGVIGESRKATGGRILGCSGRLGKLRSRALYNTCGAHRLCPSH
jgi:hypothetical protein